MKTTLFFKKYRFSKRIVIKNSNSAKEDDYKNLTKNKFLEALYLVPVADLGESIIFTRKKARKKRGRNTQPDTASDRDSSYSPSETGSSLQDNEGETRYDEDFPQVKVLCKICGREFANRRLLLKHKEQQHSGAEPYSCLQCSESFSHLDILIAHIRSHKGKLPFECKVCKDTFESYKDFNNHRSVHVLFKIDYPRLKVFKCEQCSKEFRKLCDLDRHTRVHTGEKPYECLICKKKFQQAHNLTKHLIIHTKEKEYKCEVCGKEFGRSDVLNRHMITHTVDKPHHCSRCNKSFGRISQLNEHVRKHHRESSLG